MPTSDYFADTYAAAREKFRASADAAGADLRTYDHPALKGPDSGTLAIDVAFVGHEDASRCLLLISGTHGVEGFAGSGCQVGFLRDQLYLALGKNTCAILIHALNPYGFAWLRRVNEDNVDLNRNVQDFGQPLPPNEAYERIHGMLIPTDWHGAGRRAADEALEQYIQAHGFQALQQAASSGQYTHPSGLFFGGTKATWSIEMLRTLLRTHVPKTVSRLVAIDIHTGLGPYGYGEPIFPGNDLRQFKRMTSPARFGPEVKSLESGDSASAVVTGTIDLAFKELTFIEDRCFLALEFGTVPVNEVLRALRGDHWLHSEDNIESPLRDQIKKDLRDAFYVDTPDWKAAVYGRTVDFAIRASRVLKMP